MGDFCSQITETINDTNYLQSFTPSSLPNNGTGFSVNSMSNGLIDSNTVDTYVISLLTKTNAVPPANIVLKGGDTNPALTYATNATTLRNNLANEYCFYYKRYIYILQKVLFTAASSSGVDITKSTDFVTRKQNAQNINSKLNQLLQIIQGVINARSSSLNDYYGTNTGVNALNGQLDAARNSLSAHMGALQSNDLSQEMQSSMLEYTIEKNSSSRNMLAIYGFMNIVAASMLFYLYRSL